MSQGYKVNNQIFTNLWRALDYAKQKNSHVNFVYHNDVFCNLQGMKVDQSYDYRSVFLKKLFKQSQNLLYSGGSDSHTILKLSESLGLQWESVVTVLSGPTEDSEANNEYLPAINYLKNTQHNHVILNHDLSYYEKIYSDPNWMYKHGGEINFRPDYIDANPLFSKNKNYISGQEKPWLLYKEGRWYSWFVDTNCIEYIHLDNVTFFYVSPQMPEIYIQDCRKIRDIFVDKHGLPEDGTIVERKMYNRDILNNYSNTNKSNTVVTNNKNSLAVKHLWQMGRTDLIYQWLTTVQQHKENHQYGLKWNDNFVPQDFVSWLIDIDSLESLDTAELHNLLHKKVL